MESFELHSDFKHQIKEGFEDITQTTENVFHWLNLLLSKYFR